MGHFEKPKHQHIGQFAPSGKFSDVMVQQLGGKKPAGHGRKA
jgi:hypothetical protein